MGKKDPRVDAYIAKSAQFARPVMEHLRKSVHAACPDVKETIKWSCPFFMHHGILCCMAAYRQHCMFRLWRPQMAPRSKGEAADRARGQLTRLTGMADLPKPAELQRLLKSAVAAKESGETPRRTPQAKKKSLTVPADLKAALARNKKAQAQFAAFSPSKRKEYVEWITAAKRAETRSTRLATAVKWIGEGKARNWKYEKC